MKTRHEFTSQGLTASLLTGALLLTLGATTSAQEEEAATSETFPFTYVSGSPVGPPEITVGKVEIKDGITYTYEFTVKTVMDFDDDRLDGDITIIQNMMEGPISGGSSFYQPATYRIENADGAWAGSGIQFGAETKEGRGPISLETYILHGEGAYEGLTVQLFSTFLEEGPPSPHGILFEAEEIAMPDPVQPS